MCIIKGKYSDMKCRAQAKVTMMYRTVNNVIEVSSQLLQPTRSISRGANSHSYMVPHSRLACHQKSFPDTIRLYGTLCHA